MSVTNGIIQASVRLQADIMAALGLTSPQVGYICSNEHGKICMWDKYKPTRVPMAVCRSGAGGATLLDIDSLGRKYWQGTDGNCGLEILWYSKLNDMRWANIGTENGWKYLAPLGGASSPYRMGDFIGYSTAVSATSGIGVVVLQGTSFAVGDVGATLIFNHRLQSDYALGYADIAALKDCKFGAYLTKVGSDKATSVMAAQTVLNGGNSVILSGNNSSRPSASELINSDDGVSETLSDGSWLIHPYLYSMSSGQYCAIPYVASKEGVAGSDSMKLTVSAAAPAANVLVWLSDNDGLFATLNVRVWGSGVSGTVRGTVNFYPLSQTVNPNNPPAAEIQYGTPQSFSGTASGNNFTWSKTISLESALSGGCQLLATASVGGSTYTCLATERW